MKPKKALFFKRFISILLVLLLISSCVFLAGCQSGAFNPEPEEEIEDPEDPEEEEILEVIRNGKFDQQKDSTSTAFPVEPKNWSASADSYDGKYAPTSSSDVRRGIISIDAEYYTQKFQDEKMVTSSMTENDKVALDNPKKPDDEDDNDKLLMIGNIKPTASKYTSSSLSVPINSYAIISVWVNTVLIDKDGDHLDADASLALKQGATISITGGVDKPVVWYGINTGGFWKEYKFIIEGSSASAKNITLELGLGTGSPINEAGYTEGFAFFADAEMKYITKKAFNALTAAETFEFGEINYGKHEWEDSPAIDKIISYSFKNANVVDSFNDLASFKSLLLDGDGTTDFTGNSDFSVYKNIDNFNSISSEKIKDDLKEENFPFADSHITVLQKNQTSRTSVGIVNEKFLTIKEGDYYRISFWAKTSDISQSGLNAYLVNTSYAPGETVPNGNIKNFLNINTTAYKLTAEEDAKVTNANKWDGWRQYSFYVDGGLFERGGTEKTLALEIWFGSINLNYEIDNLGNAVPVRKIDSKLSNDPMNFPEKDSYAMLTNIEVEKLYRSVYSSASSGDNSVTGFSLSNRYGSNALTNGAFNNVKESERNITDRPMLPANFTGSYRNGAPQGNNVVYSGIVNTNLINPLGTDPTKYPTSAPWYASFLSAIDILKALQGGDWNSLLMIYNRTATAYGYASDNITLSANSYYEISVSVKTVDGAKANIYLVDDDGNILGNYILDKYGYNKISGSDLTKDKASVYNPFYEEKYDHESDKYIPDLEYENSDENKLLRKGTKYVVASTIPVENPFYDEDYNKKQADKDKQPTWKKETTKYFMYDESYCNRELSSTDVKKLYEIIAIDYEAEARFEVMPTGDEFVTYTFFIKTGSTLRNVTLELWNGSKYSNDNSEGAVFFDVAMNTSPTNEEFYDYVFNKKIYDVSYSNDTSMFLDMSGYDNDSEQKAATTDPSDDGDEEGTPFDWLNLIYILPTSAMIIALAIVVIRKLMKKKTVTEQTVTETPTYARGKTSKKSSDDNKK